MGHQDKNYYEQLIKDSPYFLLDKTTEVTRAKAEKHKLETNIYLYVCELNQKKYQDYGLEILKITDKCLKYYNSDMGDFLNYFSKVLKKDFAIIKAKEYVEQSKRGVYIPEEDRLNLNKLRKFLQVKGINFTSQEFIDEACEILSIEKEKVEELIKLEKYEFLSSREKNTQGEEYDIFDIVENGEKSFFEKMIEQEDSQKFLNCIELVFKEKKQSQRGILAALLTSKIVAIFSEDKTIYSMVKKMSYFDEDIYTDYVLKGKTYSAREIAKKFGVLEQSVSRIYAGFVESFKRGLYGH